MSASSKLLVRLQIGESTSISVPATVVPWIESVPMKSSSWSWSYNRSSSICILNSSLNNKLSIDCKYSCLSTRFTILPHRSIISIDQKQTEITRQFDCNGIQRSKETIWPITIQGWNTSLIKSSTWRNCRNFKAMNTQNNELHCLKQWAHRITAQSCAKK